MNSRIQEDMQRGQRRHQWMVDSNIMSRYNNWLDNKNGFFYWQFSRISCGKTGQCHGVLVYSYYNINYWISIINCKFIFLMPTCCWECMWVACSERHLNLVLAWFILCKILMGLSYMFTGAELNRISNMSFLGALTHGCFEIIVWCSRAHLNTRRVGRILELSYANPRLCLGLV